MFTYSPTSTFPASTWASSNYWVDVIYEPNVLLAPTGLTATSGDAQVALSWTAASGATGYSVQRATVSGGPYTSFGTPTTATFTDTGLTNGTTYYYVMAAVNSAGTGPNSSQASATPNVLPTAPTGLTATGGNAQATLSWTAVSGATSYKVQRASTSGGPYTSVGTPTAGSFIDTGLTNATIYYYVVAAVNSAGTGPNSSEASATPTALPVAPTSVTATAGDAHIALSWTAASGATGYSVQRATVSGGPYTSVGTPTTATFTDTGLTNGTTYYYVVAAVNSAGTGPNSSQASATPNVLPTAPTGLTATGGNAQAALSWTSVSGATGYSLQRATASGGPYTSFGAPTVNSFTDTGLTDGTTYFCVVAAVNSAGTGPNSSQITATPNAPPLAPVGLTATAGSTQVALSWTALAGATGYNVQRATVSGGPYVSVGTPATSGFTDTGLSNGATYYYVVAAVNSAGTGPNSSQLSGTPDVLPATPTGLTAMAGSGQVVLSWTAITGAASYNVRRATVSGGPYTNIGSPTTATFTDTGLTNGTTYYYVVAAVNSAGTTPNSSQASATPNVLPAAPTGVTATAGITQVALSWTAVPGATGYNVQRSTSSGGPYTSVGAPTTSGFTNTGLTNGTTYYYVMAALNSTGTGPNSSQVSATPTTTVTGPSCPPCFSVWNSSTTPGTPDWNDATPVELGVTFQPSTNGYAMGVRSYKGTGNTGTHTGHLRSSSGTLLATATFTGETASGWQQVNFSNPVPVSANTTYVASYFAPRGNFALDANSFAFSSVNNLPLQALSDLASPLRNGVFAYSSTSTFPNNSYNASNYWVDLVFQTTAPQGVSAIVGSGQTSLTWQAVSGATSYNVKRATLSGGPYTVVATPSATTYLDSGVTNGTTYYYVVTAVTPQGESSNSIEVDAITPPAVAPTCPCVSVWPSTTSPGTADLTAETLPMELGVVFRPTSSGYIMGIRFYKGTGNTGIHVGNLWSSKGTLLATAQFTGESASGW